MVKHRWIAGVTTGVGVLFGSGMLGCSNAGGLGLGMFSAPTGTLSIVSTAQPTRLDTSFQTAVYSYQDENTADLYFSDLSIEQIEALASGSPRSEAAPEGGQILHLHLFLTPRAGRTPIEFSASNVTLTHLVLAGDAIGVYGGGGFLLPSRTFAIEPGGSRFGGRMRDATLRFVEGTPDFHDRLGSGVISASLSARLDPEAATRLDTLLRSLARIASR